MESVRKGMLSTLAFFDLFDFPLTASELHRYFWREDGSDEQPATLSEIMSLAERETATDVRDGFYFFRGKPGAVARRRERHLISERKFAKARAFCAAFAALPSVRAIAVCNSLAFSNAGEESDVDLFIICEPGTLWATRLAVSGLLAAMRARPAPGVRDPLCASFFLSTEAMDLSRIKERDDVYLPFWLASLVPLYDDGVTFAAFLAANRWARGYLPNAFVKSSSPERMIRKPFDCAFALPLFTAVDKVARELQWRLFPKSVRGVANTTSAVVVSNQMLKFHLNDRRAEFARRFREKLRQFQTQPIVCHDAR